MFRIFGTWTTTATTLIHGAATFIILRCDFSKPPNENFYSQLNGVVEKCRFETSAAEISVVPASANGK